MVKRELALIKCDMSRGDYPSSGKIKASITTMIRWVPKKDTSRRPSSELIRGCGCLIWKTKATKHSQMMVFRWSTKQQLKGCEASTGLARPAINEVCGSGQGLDLE